MNWLRRASIASFIKLNPTWEVRLIRSHPSLQGLPLGYAQKADISWWLALKEHGGFATSTDIVFTKPVPDEWLDAELCCCTKGYDFVYQLAMIGCTPGHLLLETVVEAGWRKIRTAKELDYQALGVHLYLEHKHLIEPHYELPMNALCYYDDSNCVEVWKPGVGLGLPDEAIGVHWYGGHETSKSLEHEAHASSGYKITNLAVEAI
jgi:hypothetical protein